jgi:predicted thioesterase
MVFSFCVFDDVGEIASGIHERFVVNEMKFMQKAVERK